MAKKDVKKKIAHKKATPKHPVKVIKKTVTTTTTTTPMKSGSKKKDSKRKPAKKKTTKKRKTTKRKTMPKTELKAQKILVENFVALQKVMVNLSVKFDELSGKISKLLELFEISAKSLAEKDLTLEKTNRDDEKIMKKIDNLGEQNKIIARGMTLMHEKLSEEPEEEFMPHQPQPRPMPRPPQQMPKQMQHSMPPKQHMPVGNRPAPSQNQGDYEKSIYSPQPSKETPE